MPSLPPSLPPEVIREILLAGMPSTPPDNLSDSRDPDTSYEFLKTACLVHSFWKELALPLLYSCVYIKIGKTKRFLKTIKDLPTRTRWIKHLDVQQFSECSLYFGDLEDSEDHFKLFDNFFRTVVRCDWPLLRQIGPFYIPTSRGSVVASFFARCPSLEIVDINIVEDEGGSRKRMKSRDVVVDALRKIRSVSLQEHRDDFGRAKSPFFLHLGRSSLTTPSSITSLCLRDFDLRTSFPKAREEAYRRVASQLVHLSIEDTFDDDDDDDDENPDSAHFQPFLHHSPNLLSFSYSTSTALTMTVVPRGHPTLEEVKLGLFWGRDTERTSTSSKSNFVDNRARAIEAFLDLLHPRWSSSNFPRLKTFGLLRTEFIPPGRQSRPATTVEVNLWSSYRGGKEGWLKWDETQLMWPTVVKACRARGLELKDDEGTVWKDGMGLSNMIQEVKWY